MSMARGREVVAGGRFRGGARRKIRHKVRAAAILLVAPLVQVLLWAFAPYQLLPADWSTAVFSCSAAPGTLLVNVFMRLVLRWTRRQAVVNSVVGNALVAAVMLFGMRLFVVAIPGFSGFPLIGALIAFLWFIGVCGLLLHAAVSLRARARASRPGPVAASDPGAGALRSLLPPRPPDAASAAGDSTSPLRERATPSRAQWNAMWDLHALQSAFVFLAAVGNSATDSPTGAAGAVPVVDMAGGPGSPGFDPAPEAWPPTRPLRYMFTFALFLGALNVTCYFQFAYVALFAAYSDQPTVQLFVNVAFNVAFFAISLGILRIFRTFLAGLLPAGQAPLILTCWLMYLNKSFRLAMSFRAGSVGVLAFSVLFEIAMLAVPLAAKLAVGRLPRGLASQAAALVTGRLSLPARLLPASRSRRRAGGEEGEGEGRVQAAFVDEAAYSVFVLQAGPELPTPRAPPPRAPAQALISVLASLHFLVWLAACRFGPAASMWPFSPAALPERRAAPVAVAPLVSACAVALAWAAAALFARPAPRPAAGPEDPEGKGAPLSIEMARAGAAGLCCAPHAPAGGHGLGLPGWQRLVPRLHVRPTSPKGPAPDSIARRRFVNAGIISYGAAYRSCTILAYYFSESYEPMA